MLGWWTIWTCDSAPRSGEGMYSWVFTTFQEDRSPTKRGELELTSSCNFFGKKPGRSLTGITKRFTKVRPLLWLSDSTLARTFPKFSEWFCALNEAKNVLLFFSAKEDEIVSPSQKWKEKKKSFFYFHMCPRCRWFGALSGHCRRIVLFRSLRGDVPRVPRWPRQWIPWKLVSIHRVPISVLSGLLREPAHH